MQEPFSHVRYAVIGCKLKQNANEGCNSSASLAGLVFSFIARFILLVIAPLRIVTRTSRQNVTNGVLAQRVGYQNTFGLMQSTGFKSGLLCGQNRASSLGLLSINCHDSV